MSKVHKPVHCDDPETSIEVHRRMRYSLLETGYDEVEWKGQRIFMDLLVPFQGKTVSNLNVHAAGLEGLFAKACSCFIVPVFIFR